MVPRDVIEADTHTNRDPIILQRRDLHVEVAGVAVLESLFHVGGCDDLALGIGPFDQRAQFHRPVGKLQVLERPPQVSGVDAKELSGLLVRQYQIAIGINDELSRLSDIESAVAQSHVPAYVIINFRRRAGLVEDE